MSPIVLDQSFDPAEIHPALRSFGTTFRIVFVRGLAYVSGLAVLAAMAANVFGGTPVAEVIQQPVMQGWSPASRPHPAFAVSQFDSSARTETYEILRHPDGGRKDILRWAATSAESPSAEIEIYRPGSEIDAFATPEADLTSRVGIQNAPDAEAAGIIDTKFGPVALLRFINGDGAKSHGCLGFVKNFESPKLRISGWSCQGETATAQRAQLGCTLNRLILLSAGNDPKVAELFARAELRRAGCLSGSAPAADWVTAPQEPQLRGRI